MIRIRLSYLVYALMFLLAVLVVMEATAWIEVLDRAPASLTKGCRPVDQAAGVLMF